MNEDDKITEGRARAIAVAAVQMMHGAVMKEVREWFEGAVKAEIRQIGREIAAELAEEFAADSKRTRIGRIARKVAREEIKNELGALRIVRSLSDLDDY